MQIGQMEEGRGGPTKKHLIYFFDSLFDMKLTYIYMLLYMQAPSEAPVHEEHQTGDPPFTSQQVCLCRSLSLYVWKNNFVTYIYRLEKSFCNLHISFGKIIL